jgi:hypothetical protein
MVTYPGLPGSRITPYLAREASGEHGTTGTGFRLTRAGISAPDEQPPGIMACRI